MNSPDLIFVRDLVLPARIGIFAHERLAPQDIRVSVTAAVPPPAAEPASIEDTFSYDLIIAAVRGLVAEGHVDLVETLAERIAIAVLRHDRVLKVTVRVEKLEIVAGGSVGVEIVRNAAGAA